MAEQLMATEIDVEQAIADFFKDADALDLDAMMARFADDIDLRIANNPKVSGRADAEETFRQFWSHLKGMSHQKVEMVINGNDAAQMAIVTYTRADGHTVALPVASHLRFDSKGLLNRLWIYIDIAPLFAAGA